MVRNGLVVALPFERLFGLAANALDNQAVSRVAEIKDRPSDSVGERPISVILPEMDAVFEVASQFPALAKRLADRYWPGPLTILVPARPNLPAPLVSAERLIGVRLPGPCAAAELAKTSGLILTATSANRAGGKDATSHEPLAAIEGVALVMEGSVPGPPGSTVVDASKDRPVVVRRGVVEIEEGSP